MNAAPPSARAGTAGGFHARWHRPPFIGLLALLAALLGTLETVLGPVWVWLIHGETATTYTIIGGTIVVVALIIYLLIGNRTKPA